MPEANVLYTVTAVVVAGLVVWVLAALKLAKQPWARPEAAAALGAARAAERTADVPVEGAADSAADSAVGEPSAIETTGKATRVKKAGEEDVAEDASEEKDADAKDAKDAKA